MSDKKGAGAHTKNQESLVHLDREPTDFDPENPDGEAEYGACCCCLNWAICCCCRWICKCCSICGYWTGLKCCCCVEPKRKYRLYLEHDRHCTDVPFCLLFSFCFLIQIILLSTAISNGADPRWLVYVVDYNGTVCDPNDADGGYGAWPDIRMYDIRICVDHCNDTLTDPRMVTPSFDSDLSVTYDNNSLVVDVSGYETTTLFTAYCLPDPDTITDFITTAFEDEYSSFIGHLDTVTDSISLAIADISICRYLFIISFFTAIIASFAYGVALRYIADLVIWASIGFTIIGVFLIAYYLIDYSYYAYAFGYDTIGDFMYYAGWIIGCGDGMFLLAVCVMFYRIRLAIALSKETTRALGSVWHMFFYPIAPFLVFALYSLFWCISSVYIASVVDKTWIEFPTGADIPYYDGGPTLAEALDNPTHYAEYKTDSTWQYALLYQIFMMYWVLEFIGYHTYMVIAGVYAEWYFADWKDDKQQNKLRGSGKNKLSNWPISNSLHRTTFYHLGTVAFASLLIALIEFAEFCLNYFEKKLIGAEPSPLQRAIMCAVKCCLKCMKCILDRINRNGLIITTIYGTPYCSASIKAISLMFRNILRASALSMVSGYLEKLGKVAIISFNMGLTIMLANYWYNDRLSSLLVPALYAFIVTLAVAWQYIHLYEVGLNTVFICFLIDEECNKGGHMRASRRLQKIIGETQAPRDVVVRHAHSFRSEHMDQKHVGHIRKQTEMTQTEIKHLSQLDIGSLADETDPQNEMEMALAMGDPNNKSTK